MLTHRGVCLRFFLAIDLIAEIPPKECTERVVNCDGGDGPLGHPKVYINLVCLFNGRATAEYEL